MRVLYSDVSSINGGTLAFGELVRVKPGTTVYSYCVCERNGCSLGSAGGAQNDNLLSGLPSEGRRSGYSMSCLVLARRYWLSSNLVAEILSTVDRLVVAGFGTFLGFVVALFRSVGGLVIDLFGGVFGRVIRLFCASLDAMSCVYGRILGLMPSALHVLLGAVLSG